ncbi:M28 family peptidase [Aureispira]|nr:M28 family peptidase [Aureispira sp.]
MKTLHFFLINLLLSTLILICCLSCETDNSPPPPHSAPLIDVPIFNRDSAYSYVQKQVDFGPRVPETQKHNACANWLKEKFHSFGWKTQFQEAIVTGFDDQPMHIKNIIATLNPNLKNRILVCAHWDTRRIADQDTENKDKPILGADDGGSGVGVLLELARALSTQEIKTGVDIVLFDAEDQGESSNEKGEYRKKTWCIGSQYWSKNMHTMTKKPFMGILLDMVGSKGARFPREGLSVRHAAGIVNQVWGEALGLGYSDLFVNDKFQELVDDHLFINDIAKIPTIDIINLPTNPTANGTFGHYWHTHKDNMSIIDKHTLGAVGDVLIQVLYKNSAGVL